MGINLCNYKPTTNNIQDFINYFTIKIPLSFKYSLWPYLLLIKIIIIIIVFCKLFISWKRPQCRMDLGGEVGGWGELKSSFAQIYTEIYQWYISNFWNYFFKDILSYNTVWVWGGSVIVKKFKFMYYRSLRFKVPGVLFKKCMNVIFSVCLVKLSVQFISKTNKNFPKKHHI